MSIVKQIQKINEVSIIMCCYNSEDWISKTIESVLKQDFPKFEFIIINDGSTDSTKNILDQYVRQDRRIKVFNQKNHGLTKSLNTAIDYAKNNWIARIDSDDICESNRISKQINFISESNNIKIYLIASSWIGIDNIGNEISRNKYILNSKQIKNRIKNFIPTLSHSTVMFNKNIFKKIGGYRERLKTCQDIDLWIRFSEIGEIECITDFLVKVRSHNRQITKLRRREQLINSSIAFVSYILRKKNYSDPIVTLSDEDYLSFQQFIEKSLTENFFSLLTILEKIKINLIKRNYLNFLYNLLKILISLDKIKIFYYLKYKKYIFYEKIALKWSLNEFIKKTK